MYTIKDFIEKDLVVYCSYSEALKLCGKLKKEGIDTGVITNLVTVLDTEYYLEVVDKTLIRLCDDYIDHMENERKVIEFNELEIKYCCQCSQNKEFKLHEVVHVFISGFLGTGEHVTAYISAIDNESKMCEICYLHEKHEAIWVHFGDVHHIDHIYGNFVGDLNA